MILTFVCVNSCVCGCKSMSVFPKNCTCTSGLALCVLILCDISQYHIVRAHTHAHTRTYARMHTHIHIFSVSLRLSLSHIHTTHIHTHAQTHARACTQCMHRPRDNVSDEWQTITYMHTYAHTCRSRAVKRTRKIKKTAKLPRNSRKKRLCM